MVQKPQRLPMPILAALSIFFVFVFFASQKMGGQTIDEAFYLVTWGQIRSAVLAWLAGGEPFDFRENSVTLYGMLPAIPAYEAASVLYIFFRFPESVQYELKIFFLHLFSFIWSTGTCFVVFHIVRILTENKILSYFSFGLIALYPTWLGHSFFNFKDAPLAFFFSLALFGALYCQEAAPKQFRLGVLIVTLGTVGAGAVKLAGMPLLIVQWSGVLYAAISSKHRGSYLATIILSGMAIIAGVYVVTPAAWFEPVDYLIAAVEAMAHFPWPGCMITFGECIGPTRENWSSFHYLVSWLSVRLPLVVIVLLVPMALLLSFKRKAKYWILLLTPVVPLLAIIGMNSTLYDGVRHVLFVLPPLFVICIVGLNELWKISTGLRVLIGASLSMVLALFIVDDIILFPYNYVYFNEMSRGYAISSEFDLDYWGFSLEEAHQAVPANQTYYYGVVRDMQAAHAKPGQFFVHNPEELAPGTQYYSVVTTRGNRGVGRGCEPVHEIIRQLPFAREPMVLARVNLCNG
ncbi:hypothetical protein [Oricola sp.]|uniref:hypothetical protein n=1 Tax=Oricola sp. TaxID=1979950 RepID=UPI0035128859